MTRQHLLTRVWPGTCFLYIHTHSHEVRGVQPPSWQASGGDDATAEAAMLHADPHGNLTACDWQELHRAIEWIESRGLRAMVPGSTLNQPAPFRRIIRN